MRIGLLGGTFNPPHVGHLICAQDACAQLGLDRVLLVPVHTPPHKEAVADPGVEHRVALCEAAVGDDERLGVSRVEADVPGPSYTVDTLKRLHDARPEDHLTFIVGGDMAHSLPRWREPEAILALAELGVAAREGVGRDDILEALSGHPGRRGASPLLRHAPHRHLIHPGPRPRRRGRARPLPRPRRGGRLHRERGAVRMSGPDATAVELEGAGLASLIEEHAADKKAIDIVELDLRGVLGYTDYFVICSGNTDRQTKAIHDGIREGLKKDHGLLPRRVEGVGEARWILMDYLDVVVHIFTPEARDFYRLEQLWGEAPKRAVGDE